MPNSHAETQLEFVAENSTAPEILRQKLFLQTLTRERKRTERSRRCFVLMLMECERLFKNGSPADALRNIISALSSSTRETDITGWYKEGSVIGVIFTEIGDVSAGTVASALLNKVTNALAGTLTIGQINQISLSFHVYPESADDQDPPSPADTALYPDLHLAGDSTKGYRWFKRAMDIAGSLCAIAFLSPVFLLIAVLIKLTSKGPVFFKQRRRGLYGQEFTFLKFRSMYVGNDHTIHKEYVKQFIGAQVGNAGGNGQNGGGMVYKLTGDPRVTRIGKILRRTSLDELPQFFNVLFGDMSLVGPRPPVPYEFGAYDIWHRQRLFAAKPGITGLWQVQGRSRVTFDEMVRLDLRYANARSLWLDVKILLQTPRAVISGEGAY